MAEAPRGVRLVINGRVYPCDVLRDPDRDRDGLTAWSVVAREKLPPIDPAVDSLAVLSDVLPGMCLLDVAFDC